MHQNVSKKNLKNYLIINLFIFGRFRIQISNLNLCSMLATCKLKPKIQR